MNLGDSFALSSHPSISISCVHCLLSVTSSIPQLYYHSVSSSDVITHISIIFIDRRLSAVHYYYITFQHIFSHMDGCELSSFHNLIIVFIIILSPQTNCFDSKYIGHSAICSSHFCLSVSVLPRHSPTLVVVS
jgi:hypothetical protein